MNYDRDAPLKGEDGMTPQEFGAFADLMKRQGVSAAELCRLLGCGNNQVRRWREGGASRYVALACAAILRDIQPWPY
jgi:hypothetical protein